jgi:hypothetical protein
MRMYRIELAPGEVTVFRTIEELATGVRNGVITSRARIFHNASQKWLPIEFHPHYKVALELLAGRTVDVPSPKQPEGPRFDNITTPLPSGGAGTSSFGTPTFSAPAPSAPAPSTPAPSPAPSSTPPANNRIIAELESSPAPAATASFMTAPVVTTQLLARPAELPWAQLPPAGQPEVGAAPVLDLPAISYPEITPAEEPVAESPVGPGRGRRPLHLIGAALVLVVGAYAARSTYTSAESPVPVTADRPSIPRADSVAEPVAKPTTPAPVTTRASAPSRTPAPVRGTAVPASPSAPASSGFAPALEPRAIVTAPAPKVAAAQDSVKPIAPAPVAVDLSVPALAGSDSLVPTPKQRGDSAMKRILRAVSGGKETAPRP